MLSAQTVSMAHNQSAVSLNCLCPAPPPASSLVPSRRHQPQHQVVTSVKRSSSVDLSALVIASVVNVRLQPASQRDGAAHVRSGRAHDEREGNSKRERGSTHTHLAMHRPEVLNRALMRRSGRVSALRRRRRRCLLFALGELPGTLV